MCGGNASPVSAENHNVMHINRHCRSEVYPRKIEVVRKRKETKYLEDVSEIFSLPNVQNGGGRVERLYIASTQTLVDAQEQLFTTTDPSLRLRNTV